MTDLRQRPRPDPAGPPAARPSLVLHGCLVAGAAALSGLAVLTAVVLVAWVADAGPGSGGGDAVRAAANAWLLAHGGGLTLPTGHVRGIPLGLTLLAAVVLHRAGASLGRAVDVPDLRTAGRAVAALAVPYALLAAAVAKVAATGAAAASAPAAGAGALLLAGLAGGRGLLRATDLTVPGPAELPAVARAAAVGVAGLVAAGLALVTVALLGHAGRFAELVGAVRPGFVGGVVLLLGCLLLLPNAALWAVAYAAGPGFTVGAGTGVSPFGATLGPVPAFPLLAALPGDGTPPPAVRAVLLLPVLAGVLVGWHLARHLPAPGPAGPGRLRPWSSRAARAGTFGLAAGVLAALATAVLAALAGGALGPGYLAAVGPSAWRVALALAVEVAVPAALTAAVLPGREPPAPAGRTPATRPRRTPDPGRRAGATDPGHDTPAAEPDAGTGSARPRGETPAARPRGETPAAEADRDTPAAGRSTPDAAADPAGQDAPPAAPEPEKG